MIPLVVGDVDELLACDLANKNAEAGVAPAELKTGMTCRC